MKIIVAAVFIFFSVLIPLKHLAQTPLKFRDTTHKGPQTFAIIMGVSKYKYIRPLQFADKDAELFRDYLKSPAGGLMKDENIFLLLNENADNANFWSKGFQWLKAKKLQQGDKLFIYLAGHGDAIDQDQFFFLAYDCNPGNDKNNYLVGGAIQLFNLKKKIAAETAKGVDVFFIMDACRTNELPGGPAGQNFLNAAITEKKAGEIIMLATGAGQESLEDASIGNGHGLFTYYLIDGLRGLADSIHIKDYKVTLSEIKSYVDLNVKDVALKRFNKIQSPFFCCDDNSDDVVSIVDSVYLVNFLKIKMELRKGGGNSFSAINTVFNPPSKNDTALTGLYNRFNNAIKLSTETGRNQANEIFDLLEKRFPGTPHTLDAKSTLAATYIRFAQSIMNSYINKGAISPEQKKEYQEAAIRLEKATQLLAEDEPEFTESLQSRLYFLKTVDAAPNNMAAFQNAYSSLAKDKNAAFINNRLATMHLENKHTDSAVYYAKHAITVAPNWRAPYSVLSETYKALNLPDSVLKYEQLSNAPNTSKPVDISKKSTNGKPRFGFMAGAGVNKLNPTLSGRQTTNIINATSLNSAKLSLGVLFFTTINKNFGFRPSLNLSFENTDVKFQRRNVNGTIGGEIIGNQIISANLNAPFLLNLTNKKNNPFFMFGPSYSYTIAEGQDGSDVLPILKSTFSAEVGLGLNIDMKKTGFIISPEIKYTAGLNNIKKESGTEYSTIVSSLKKQGYSLSFYFRKK